MSRFVVLDAANEKERLDWIDLWTTWEEHEVAAHPSYVALFATPSDRVICAALKLANGAVMLPMILRPIAREVWASNAPACWDAISPYGYGGPFYWGSESTEHTAFWIELRKWALSESIISLFVRLSLFPEQLIAFDGDVVDNAPNVVRFLDLAPEELWRDYEHKVRKNVNRAKREGIRVEIDMGGTRLNDFLAIYYNTMDRRRAESAYYFDRDFFSRMIEGLHGKIAFFHAIFNKCVVSTELVMISADHIYSFLGGTRAEAFEMRPNDMLKHEIILWGQRTGKKAYVLGGGYGGPDGIFRYKRSFAPHGEVVFRTGQIVFNTAVYDRLVATRRSWEEANGRDWKQRSGFFPAYRA